MNGGRHWEALARKFLVSQGLRFVEANFARRFGEIDLIMQDGTTLIFVEVKYRSSERFGSSLEQVTPGKIRKIKLAAQAYLNPVSRKLRRCALMLWVSVQRGQVTSSIG